MISNNIGMNLKNIRKNKGITIEEFSRKVCIPINTINLVESNKIDVPISVLMKYSKFFKISLDELCINNIKYTEASLEKAIYFVNKIEEVSLRNNINFDIGNSFDMDMLGSCIDLCMFTNDFSESKYFKVISLFKLIVRGKFTESQIDDVLEMVNMLGLKNEELFTNDELTQMFQIFRKMILAKNNKRNLGKK